MPVHSPQIFGYFMKLWHRFGRVCSNLAQNIVNRLLRSRIHMKHHCFTLPWNSNCTLLLLQHENVSPASGFHSFCNNFEIFFHSTVTLQPGRRKTSIKMLIHAWILNEVWMPRAISLLRSVLLPYWFYKSDISAVKHWAMWVGKAFPWLCVVKILWWSAIRCIHSVKS